MTGDREPGHAPSKTAHWRTKPQRAPNHRERRIQRSRDRLRNPMIPGVNLTGPSRLPLRAAYGRP